jgi:hypothetical protein
MNLSEVFYLRRTTLRCHNDRQVKDLGNFRMCNHCVLEDGGLKISNELVETDLHVDNEQCLNL